VLGYFLLRFLRNRFGALDSVILGVAIALVFTLIVGEIFARMSYTRWKYEFTQTELKLERGIIWKRYSNIPYERIQNVDLHRGVIARMFGFSTLNIQTAGYASSYGRGLPKSEGHIPAVSTKRAEEIRNFLMKKISKGSRSGL